MVEIVLGWSLIVVGMIGCVVPMIPGPPIAFCALLVAKAMGDSSAPSLAVLLSAFAVVVVVTVLDFVVPALGAKRFHCSRSGMIGCFIGTIAGLFFLPLGVIVGPFLGALIGEVVTGKDFGASLWGATGALIGFVFGVIIKLVGCGYVAYCFYQAVA